MAASAIVQVLELDKNIAIHPLSSACDRSSVCFVFGLCMPDGSKTKHMKLLQGESGGLGLGYVDSVPSQDNLQMRRN